MIRKPLTTITINNDPTANGLMGSVGKLLRKAPKKMAERLAKAKVPSRKFLAERTSKSNFKGTGRLYQ